MIPMKITRLSPFPHKVEPLMSLFVFSLKASVQKAATAQSSQASLHETDALLLLLRRRLSILRGISGRIPLRRVALWWVPTLRRWVPTLWIPLCRVSRWRVRVFRVPFWRITLRRRNTDGWLLLVVVTHHSDFSIFYFYLFPSYRGQKREEAIKKKLLLLFSSIFSSLSSSFSTNPAHFPRVLPIWAIYSYNYNYYKMREINKDLFDPRTMMEPEYQGSPRDGNFGFAFNDSNFSDRVLRIEIMAGPSDSKSDGSSGGDGDGCSSLLDWGARHCKRRRANLKKKDVDNVDVNLVVDDDNPNVDDVDININVNPPDDDDDNQIVDGADVAAACAEEQVLNQSDADDVLGGENDDEEAVAMAEESLSGDEEANSNDSSWSMECTTVMRVQTLHISSPILAAKSPFFYKLFSNGMKESEQRHVTLRINESEEAALMELLNFMYSNTLTANTATALLDVLMAADKFEVASCMRYCSRMLRNMPMTPESALLYLDLPLMADAVKPLTDAAKQYLADRYKDITKFQEEVMSLPISGIEAVLSSDGLQVASEDTVYDFVLKWLRAQYPKIEDRREILATRLARYIRFPYMTCRKLKKALTCPDFDREQSSKLVMEALFFKAEAPHRQRILIAEESAQTSRRFLERAYKYRPVKVVDFDLPCQQCVVYLDLKREECANLFPSGRVYSQAFHLGGQGFFLSAHCNMDQQSSFHCFGLFLGMQEKGSVSFGVDYEFAVRSKPTEDFQSKYKGNYTFTGGKAVGYRNLFGIPWISFMAEDSLYFINDVLHLRAELTIRH